MMASGIISGPTSDSYGSKLELAWQSTRPLTLKDSSERMFIQGDNTVTLRGFSERDGLRIGFGAVSTKLLPVFNSGK
jgi:fumarylacetoacetase